MRKMDEMEKSHNGIATKYGFFVTILLLLIWSLINYIQTQATGWQLTIALIGCAVYGWIRVYYNRIVK
ncbi:hypothetical protein ACQVTU_09445 [Bacillus cereus]|uniref:Uncharacterized protein n=2 Tax=Bacillus thuringiensis TaxID=1428 RepID=W8Y5W6_BACTU|nr:MULTISPECIES: hypothetical protein [Bacillus cereus group]CDN33806.1 unnamed protein product [Bacillus thuringiensis DB27]MBG9632673.1 hypothetical protein [Bacillus thuringiensis]MBG9668066.1 hypothetical protein [Bacillus thuringiensis]MBH0355682.1 hypothetical protein [Bacillus thuringiensis]MDF9627022.1 hypothetical protein [Bacillus cereus]